MKIGILGVGMIGGTLTAMLVAAGHQVWVANTRGPASLRELVDPLGAAAHAATPDEAASIGELVVISVPVAAYPGMPAPLLANKVVIDTSNYSPARDGRWSDLDTGRTTSSELLAGHLPEARVVKTFNTIYFADLRTQPQPRGTPGRRALPMAGDDPPAKALAGGLVDGIGFDVLDVGPLAAGRRFQPGSSAYNIRLDIHELAGALDL